jgi:hypothetical protein
MMMKENDSIISLSSRQEGKEKSSNLRGFLLYSAGEDFYSMYHENRDIDPEIGSVIIGFKGE